LKYWLEQKLFQKSVLSVTPCIYICTIHIPIQITILYNILCRVYIILCTPIQAMHYFYYHHHRIIIIIIIIIIPLLLCYYYYYYIFDILHIIIIIIIRWRLLHVLARTYILFAAFGPACRNMSYRSLAADRVYKATTDDLQPERKNSVGTVFKKAFGTLSSSPRRRLSEPLMSGVPVIGTGNINTPLRYITRAYINICVWYG